MKRFFIITMALIGLVSCEPHPTCTCETYYDGELIRTRDYQRDSGCFDNYESNYVTIDGERVRVEVICSTD